MRREIGKVSTQERDEIQMLFERKKGLNELAKILNSDNHEMYERLVRDLGDTTVKFQQWWEAKSKKYNWESDATGRWEINFDTCAIFLITAE